MPVTHPDSAQPKPPFKNAKREARLFGIVSAVLLLIVLFISDDFAKVGLVVTGWLFMFHGTTVVSLALERESRRWFQIFVSSAVPILASLYFIKDTPSVTFGGVAGHMISPSYLFVIALIGYFSWAGADVLNKDHPFRGFLIVSTFFFVICFMGHHGYYGEYDDYSDETGWLLDKEAAKRAAETGRYFGQFWLYVTVSYGAMLFKMMRKSKAERLYQQADKESDPERKKKLLLEWNKLQEDRTFKKAFKKALLSGKKDRNDQ